MLGRTASSLYWLCRYVERAENMARLLDVGHRMTLAPGLDDDQPDQWESTLRGAAAADLYAAILDDIERHDYDVCSRRAAVSKWGKLQRLPGIWWRSRTAGG